MSWQTTRRPRTYVFVALSLLTFPVLGGADHDDRKMTLCHVPRGNPGARHTLTVGESSVDKHLDHGDYLGRCRGGRRTDSGDNLERAEDKLEREKQQAERDHNLDRAEDKLARAKRDAERGDSLERAGDRLEREKRLTKARAERDLELNKARLEANRESSRRKADERYREMRRQILDRYYDRVRDINEQTRDRW